MPTVNKLIPQGQGLAPVLLKRAATLELDWTVRQQSSFDTTDSQGQALHVALPAGTVLRGGDVLVTDAGDMVRVLAAPQPVLVVTPCAEHGSPLDIVRAAYQVGKRMAAVELHPDHLKIAPDHALADMLRAMHLTVRETSAAFEPEGAPPSTDHHHHHPQGQHGHAHDHAHSHAHGPVTRGKPLSVPIKGETSHSAGKLHVHGPGCGHDH